MFEKLVVIEPVSLIPEAEKKLYNYAKEVVIYNDIPKDEEEIIKRIGDADGVLLSYTSTIGKNILDKCPNIKYIGMCCSLYSPESANVDILTANKKGIVVYGIRDYGDEGVVEYVLSELIRYLHGFGEKQWKELPLEITDLKVGVIGLGTSGSMIANTLKYMGGDLYYFSRTRKKEEEEKGIKYLPLDNLLKEVDVIFTCLNKNIILMKEKEFEKFGNGKIMFNTSIGPSHDIEALKNWLDNGNNEFFCDSLGALGDEKLLTHPNVNCMNVSSGRTKQAFDRLSKKVIENIEKYFENKNNQ
ncbi:D-isomer specific 2-hydroxyacid dehydrogenase family protein [Miniphocaeibacter halophilus]|uniref:Dihydrofolate reductase n=1 Tax=Miniphocaeibacter halophilus TaxID=2931922 RepID=A0AC61MVS4_9FIRM|nr:D-isomer specific 2-hydroxyacid dehydrogenase family protein [Miniphocaeibacter halophilus]QQK08074.1 dihydrofolate reductase [Miniphocaeibacter halophilus]